MNKKFWDWSIEQKEKYNIYGFDMILEIIIFFSGCLAISLALSLVIYILIKMVI